MRKRETAFLPLDRQLLQLEINRSFKEKCIYSKNLTAINGRLTNLNVVIYTLISNEIKGIVEKSISNKQYVLH